MQETKVTKHLDYTNDRHRLVCLPQACRHYGLGFAIEKQLAQKVEHLWSISDRVVAITFNIGKSSGLAVVKAYAPTTARCASDGQELDDFYLALSKALDDLSSSTLLFVAGDLNAKAGTRQPGELCIGSHGKGWRNISGEAPVQFCETRKLFLCNTAFQHAARHKTTWTSHRTDRQSGRRVSIYNQIDYIACHQTQQ